MDDLLKIYLEPTTLCNLDCRTCIRHAWKESLGHMPSGVFQGLMDELAAFPEARTISFAGLGEPLSHPQIADMVRLAHERGLRTEMTSNALLLTPSLARNLMEAGLDQFVVSIDGASPNTYGDIRGDDGLHEVMRNVRYFHRLYRSGSRPPAAIGIAFVAMKRNIRELPKVYKKASLLGASFVMVTNVLPYTQELEGEALFHFSLTARERPSDCRTPVLMLPKMDWTEQTKEPLAKLYRRQPKLRFLDLDIDPDRFNNHCPFIQGKSLSVSRDGAVSPCVPLLHSYSYYARGREKQISRHHVGSLPDRSLQSIWDHPEYAAFRRRVRQFDFPACPDCDCHMMDSNDTDCLGNPFPVCGDCLWARGIIRCP